MFFISALILFNPSVGVAVCGVALYEYEPRLFISSERTFRALWHMAHVAVDMKWTWIMQKRRLRRGEMSSDEVAAEDAALHQRSADRILKLCGMKHQLLEISDSLMRVIFCFKMIL
jgi:hypothetical protein